MLDDRDAAQLPALPRLPFEVCTVAARDMESRVEMTREVARRQGTPAGNQSRACERSDDPEALEREGEMLVDFCAARYEDDRLRYEE